MLGYWQQQQQWMYVGTTDGEGGAGNGGVDGGFGILAAEWS